MRKVTCLVARLVALGLLTRGAVDVATTAAQAPVIVVTSSADAGPGTLREALTEAPPVAKIRFDPAIFPSGSPTTITLTSEALPEIFQGHITIDASGAWVILDGSGLATGQGLLIRSDGNVIRGLWIVNFPAEGLLVNQASDNLIGGTNATPGGACTGACNVISGNGIGVVIRGEGARNNVVSGNTIGTDPSGAAAAGNRSAGVFVGDGARHNLVGGAARGEGNLISGNWEDGVAIAGSGTLSNTVRGNTIGTDASGTRAVGNLGRGVFILGGAQHTLVADNLISGNGIDGVPIEGDGTMYNIVRGNYIGTDRAATSVIGNAGDGLYIAFGAQYNLVVGNTIGGNQAGVQLANIGTAHNTLTDNAIGTDMAGKGRLGNRADGVTINRGAAQNAIGPGNTIAYNGGRGINVHGADTVGNAITANAIYGNGGAGIINSAGGNSEVPAPLITRTGSRFVEGLALPGATVEVYSDDADQARQFEGRTVADGAGRFVFRPPAGQLNGPNVTATARDARGNTSQLSAPGAPPAPRVMQELPRIVAPAQVSADPGVVGTNLGLALLCVLFFGFSSTVFNSILVNYRDHLVGEARHIVPRPLRVALARAGRTQGVTGRTGRARFVALWLAVSLATSLVESFLDPEVGLLSPQRVRIVLTLFISAIVIGALQLVSDLAARRRLEPVARADSKLQWVGIPIAVVCVVVSRALGFRPGYLYGIVGAVYLYPELSGISRPGKRAVSVLATVFLGGLVLWIVSAFLPPSLMELEALLLTIFLVGLEQVFFELFPLPVTDGGDVWRWKRGLWFALFAGVFFCFYHFLLNPDASGVRALRQNGVQTVLILAGVFGLATFVLWLLLPFRLGRQRGSRAISFPGQA